jgi:hypothetical protein
MYLDPRQWPKTINITASCLRNKILSKAGPNAVGGMIKHLAYGSRPVIVCGLCYTDDSFLWFSRFEMGTIHPVVYSEKYILTSANE